MKVNELIKKLNTCDGELDVLLNDEILDNLLNLKSVDLVCTYDKNFILLNVDYGMEVESEEESILV